MVILDAEQEGAEHRRLGSRNCNCQDYRNGASLTTGVCVKVEGTRNVCYPQTHAGLCSDMAMSRCGGGGNAQPSPAPGR